MGVGLCSQGMQDRVEGNGLSCARDGLHWISGGISGLKRQSGFAQGSVGNTCGCGTWGHSFVLNMAVPGQQLDSKLFQP